MTYLLDTSVLSELLKRRPQEACVRRVREQSPEALFTSVICVMELRYGTLLRSDHESFWQRILSEVLSRVHVLGFGEREALMTAEMLAHLKRVGKPIEVEDVLIGATAQTHGHTIVTHNVKHFQWLPHVKVEDWLAA